VGRRQVRASAVPRWNRPRWCRIDRRMPLRATVACVLLFLAAGCAAGAGLPRRAPTDLPWGDRPADRLALAARAAADRGDVLPALAAIDEALALEPRHVDALRLRQDLLRERGRRGLLTVEAEKAVAARPGDADAHYLLGRIVEDPRRKRVCFERAAALAPDSVWPWLGLAHVLRSADRERAIAIYARLYELTDAHPLIAVNYASALRDARRFDAAVAVYERCRGDGRVRGMADLGRAQIELLRAAERDAFGHLLAAIRVRPFEPTAAALVVRWLRAGMADDDAAALLDLLRSDPAIAATMARAGGADAVAGLLQRGGRPQAVRRLLDDLGVDAADVELRRLQRRLLLALGDVPAFLAVMRADVPRAVVAAEPNLVRGRWLQALDGPWHGRDVLAEPGLCVALVTALRDVGWLVEAELVADLALRAPGDAASALAALRDECGKQLAFEGELRRLVEDGYRSRDTAGLDDFLARVRAASHRVFGRDVVGAPRRFQAPLVGDLLDPFDGALAAHLDRYNRHLVLGRRSGGTVEAMLHTRLSLQDLPDVPELALAARCREVVVCDRDIAPLHGVWGGDIAGVALLNHFLVDFDSLRSWAGGLADKRATATADGRALLADPIPAEPGADPFDAPWRLLLASPVADADLATALLDTVRHHERQHLVDWLYYLPIEHNVWRALGLLFDFAWSPAAIEAEMERRAELASLALSPHTELVLAHILEFASAGDAPSPHVRGFGALARELTAALVAEGVAPADAAPARWAAAPMPAFRRAARRLLGQLPSAPR
jgi:tetratricopeptide (TPR) repeat protein